MGEYELYHHGVKGMKWGIRRFQKKDGTLTPAGKKRYADSGDVNKTVAKKVLRGVGKVLSTPTVMKDGYQERKMPSPVMKDGYQERKMPGAIKNITSSSKPKIPGVVKGGPTKPELPWTVKGGPNKPKTPDVLKNLSEDAKRSKELSKKTRDEMSNAELRQYNERKQLERNYDQLNPGKIKTGMNYVATAAVATTTILTLYNNSEKLIKLGSKFAEKVIKK